MSLFRLTDSKLSLSTCSSLVESCTVHPASDISLPEIHEEMGQNMNIGDGDKIGHKADGSKDKLNDQIKIDTKTESDLGQSDNDDFDNGDFSFKIVHKLEGSSEIIQIPESKKTVDLDISDAVAVGTESNQEVSVVLSESEEQNVDGDRSKNLSSTPNKQNQNSFQDVSKIDNMLESSNEKSELDATDLANTSKESFLHKLNTRVVTSDDVESLEEFALDFSMKKCVNESEASLELSQDVAPSLDSSYDFVSSILSDKNGNQLMKEGNQEDTDGKEEKMSQAMANYIAGNSSKTKKINNMFSDTFFQEMMQEDSFLFIFWDKML